MYKNYWHSTIYMMMKRYRLLQKSDRISPNEAAYKQAIKNCLDDLDKVPDGQLIKKFLAMVYFDHSMTFDGAAFKVGVSRRTAQRWVNRFVNSVGDSIGGFR